ncbi:MAG: acyl-CoA dehydrogenase family protein [Pseudomonadota bacterium]
MSLVLNEEQHLLKNSARDFLSANSPVEAFRALRDKKATDENYSDETWQQMIELGWPAITIDEAHDGLGFGYKGLGLILEEMGQRLVQSPLLSSIVLCASVIELIGTPEQKSTYLPKLAAGEITMAFAFEEALRHTGLANVQCQALAQSGKVTLSGEKKCVLNAAKADYVMVIARSSDKQLGAYVIENNASGMSISPFRLLDGTLAHHIRFENTAAVEHVQDASLSADDVLTALHNTLARVRTALAAEMLGGSLGMFQVTMAYLKEREQFDVKIGSFQALKHRASQMFVQLELAKSCVLSALNAIDDNADDLQELACLAKAQLNDTFILVTDEATQMHGGMGVTDELDVGLFLKRARVYTQLFGDSNHLRDEYATLKGY